MKKWEGGIITHLGYFFTVTLILIQFKCGATEYIPPRTWLSGCLVERSASSDWSHHNHVACVPAVPDGGTCCCLTTRADMEGHAVAGMIF